jgi:large subunit ribosomal protein L17
MLREGLKRFKLNRSAKGRKHLLRTMLTQLVEHERIRTTAAKAKAMRSLAERMIALAKRGNEGLKNGEQSFRRLKKYVTTGFAKHKVYKEIAPRLR